jgi:biofilm protein TabA
LRKTKIQPYCIIYWWQVEPVTGIETGDCMILCSLTDFVQYEKCHALFRKAHAYLSSLDQTTSEGRFLIDGDRIIAIIDRSEQVGKQKAVLEAHRHYIDIQYVLSGTDVIGWKDLSTCQHIHTPHDEKSDKMFFKDAPSNWFSVEKGSCAVFFPHDAHAPFAGTGQLKKVILKVAVDSE